MSHISIIGSSAAGKTVFLAVLATKYRRLVPGQPWLEFRNAQTETYVLEAWDVLRAGDWPKGTERGTFSRLEWTLHTCSGMSHSLSVRDAVGQDFVAIYNSEKALEAEQIELKSTLNTSSILLFLVNMREVIDAVTLRQVSSFEIPLKLALEEALKRNVHVAILLTQHDSFRDHLQATFGSLGDNPHHVLSEYLPQLFGLMDQNKGKIETFFVAAVADTEPVNYQGTVQMRPKRNFTSEGLGEVLDWIETVVADDHARGVTVAEHARRLAFNQRAWIEGLVLATLTVILAWHLGSTVYGTTFASLAKQSVKREKYEEPRTVKYTEKERQAIKLGGKYYGVSREDGPIGGLDDFVFQNDSSSTLYNVNVTVWSDSVRGHFSAAEVDPGSSFRGRDIVNMHYKPFHTSVECEIIVDVEKTRIEYHEAEHEVHDYRADDANRAQALLFGLFVGGIATLGGSTGTYLRIIGLRKSMLPNCSG